MSTATFAGHTVEVDNDGFLVNPDDWSPAIAEAIADDVGIALTERHWEVINFCRKDNQEMGTPPGVRRITKNTDVSMKEMYQLFPGGPGVLASKISGLTKPKGCV
jgi:TusE/DsrC/DsvC family sulfur relay protein